MQGIFLLLLSEQTCNFTLHHFYIIFLWYIGLFTKAKFLHYNFMCRKNQSSINTVKNILVIKSFFVLKQQISMRFFIKFLKQELVSFGPIIHELKVAVKTLFDLFCFKFPTSVIYLNGIIYSSLHLLP